MKQPLTIEHLYSDKNMKYDLNLKAKEILKTEKLYCTKGRVAVLKVLLKATKPLRQEQITLKLGKQSYDKVSVYRTLEYLLKAGIVHKAYIGKKAWYFELADNCTETQCHPHFTCTSCGETHCLIEMSLPMPKSSHKGFVIHRQQVRLEGLCPACA
jgi:Fur family ferric uptake transcriptional regulator